MLYFVIMFKDLFIVFICLTTTISLSKCNSEELLLQWLKNNGGSAKSEIFHSNESFDSYRGLRASKHIDPGSEIFFVPVDMVLSESKAKLCPFIQEVSKLVQIVDGKWSISLFLFYERFISLSSFYKHYIGNFSSFILAIHIKLLQICFRMNLTICLSTGFLVTEMLP